MPPETEAEYLNNYDPTQFVNPLVTVDNCIFTISEGKLQVLLTERLEQPALGHWSLPGGFIDQELDSNLESCARRKLKIKTAVESPYLEQVATIGNQHRDPRGWSVTTLYVALIPHCDVPEEHSKWVPVDTATAIINAFDHQELLQTGLQRLRSKVLYTALPVNLVPEIFSLTELQHAYEIVLGKSLEKKAFRRRMLNSDILAELTQMRQEGAGRPAKLYSVKSEQRGFIFTRQLGE